ncbi:hypothetical protein EYM_07550 [Ignicoccus islandicus DSM 13165]|uniref:Thiamine-binding protein domain-containing protein n=1 Tax=Ignicoccus islandicus DSM 13165 TaxID=940295 RepID=A0A0U3F7P4_9CREN|nr:MTH1187 family thiamine-binding protein [Ignicoccus islandicus]ALU12056.1 hypothetical protein EYM_07550 [Ignicoccus islandicus DSM 13165]
MIVEIQVLPLGTGSPSVSEYVAEAVKVLRDKGLNFKVTPMATVFEIDNFSQISDVLDEIRKRMEARGIKRVVFVIRIDYRSDKELKMDRKVESVMKRIRD